MPRRIALALALALTIVTTFSIVTVGSQTGLFGDDGNASASEAYVEEAPVTEWPVEQPAQPAPQAYYAPAPDPIVVTDYVYVDEPAPSQPRARAAATPKPAATPKAKPTALPADEPTVEQEPAEAPTTPPAAPTQPVAPPTAPPAPTQPPAQPADPPPAAAPEGPKELEFTGTVTAINGDIVTFSHGGTTTDVRVTKKLDALEIGTRAKVHAIKVSTGYVAKEIEIKEGA